jgi:RNA-directed DNA polymerase
MLERAKEVTRDGEWTRVEYARYADDLVILVDGYRRHAWLLKEVDRRLREELAKLDLQLNEMKSRIVDLDLGEAFGFLGFDFRRVRSLRGRWRPQYTPKLTQRTAFAGEAHGALPTPRLAARGAGDRPINPILRGWVQYFRIGNAARSFAYVRNWVEKKVRRHVMRARSRAGFGWTRWSTVGLHEALGLFHDYHVRYGARI